MVNREVLLTCFVLIGLAVGLAVLGLISPCARQRMAWNLDEPASTVRALSAVVASLMLYELLGYEIHSGITAFWLANGLGVRRYLIKKLFEIYAYTMLFSVVFAMLMLPTWEAQVATILTVLGDVALIITLGGPLALLRLHPAIVIITPLAVSLISRNLLGALFIKSNLAAFFNPWYYYYFRYIHQSGKPFLADYTAIEYSFAFVIVCAALYYYMSLNIARRCRWRWKP